MTIDNELIDNLLKDYKKPEDIIGENGLLKQLTKQLLTGHGRRVLTTSVTRSTTRLGTRRQLTQSSRRRRSRAALAGCHEIPRQGPSSPIIENIRASPNPSPAPTPIRKPNPGLPRRQRCEATHPSHLLRPVPKRTRKKISLNNQYAKARPVSPPNTKTLPAAFCLQNPQSSPPT